MQAPELNKLVEDAIDTALDGEEAVILADTTQIAQYLRSRVALRATSVKFPVNLIKIKMAFKCVDGGLRG